MKYFFTIIFLSISFSFFGQSGSKIDSLKRIINQTNSDKIKGESYFNLSKLLENKNRDSSKIYAKKAEKSAVKTKNTALLNKVFLQEGILFYKQKKDDIALTYFNKIDSIYNLDKIITSEYVKSKLYRAEISKFTFTMPGVRKAKEYLLEGLQLAKDKKDTELIYLMKYRLGEWHGFMSKAEFPKKHLDTASLYIKNVLKYYKKEKNYEFTARVYYTMASINISQKDYILAEKNYKNRLEVIKKSKDSVKIAEAYYGLGSIYRNFKKPNLGIKYLDSAKAIFNIHGFSTDDRKKSLYRDYAYLYELKKDYKKAFKNMHKAIVYKDTLYEEKNNKIAMELEAKYQNKQKQQEITILKTKNELISTQKKNQQNLLLAGLGLTSVSGIFFFFLYKNRQKTAKKLKELDIAKNEFIANITHEFRTPLTLISGPVQTLLKSNNFKESDSKHLQNIQNNSNRLLNLVDQLLDVSKIESGSLKLHVSKQNIIDFTSLVLDNFIYSAKEKNIFFNIEKENFEGESWFNTDFLQKILSNLTTNAIKYTKENGSIICMYKVQNNQFIFEIKNSGKELTKKERSQIFKRFYQVNSQNNGVGIGLALVKDLVSLHKGFIDVSNESNWTVFSFKIPISKENYTVEEIISDPNTEKFTENNSLDENTDKPILLLVEDNTEIQEYITLIFKDSFTVLVANNGKTGIDLAIKNIPDIIISDIMMPIKNGLELSKILKTDERTSHIPIILLTAKTGKENKIKGLESKVDAYITKPFNPDILQLKVSNLLEIRSNLQKRYSQEVILTPTDIAINDTDALFLKKVQQILDNNLTDSNFSITEFCEIVAMSRMQLHRKLKALFNISTSEFIRMERLKLAAKLLKESDVNISEIGYTVGFNDHAYFSKCFKKHFNCTPSQFIKR